MSDDIEESVCQTLQNLSILASQVLEPTDISGKAQLLVFVLMIRDVDIVENFLCCKALPERTTPDVTFWCMNQYLELVDLSCQKCVVQNMSDDTSFFVILYDMCDAISRTQA